jgi:hypothetical protein
MGSGPQFDSDLDGAIGKLGLGDRVPLAAGLQLGRLGGVGLQEARKFLRVAPEALEVIMEDGPVGCDADGKPPTRQLHAGTHGDLVEQADLAVGGRGQAEAQAGGCQGRRALDLGLDGNGMGHWETPSI